MQRADDLAFLDPAVAERTSRMRAPPGESHQLAAVPVNRQPQAGRIERKPSAFGHFLHPTNSHPLGHFPAPEFTAAPKNEQPRTCVRGRSASRFYLMALRPQSGVWACWLGQLDQSKRCGNETSVEFIWCFSGWPSLVIAGCDLTPTSAPDLVWGVHGIKPGRLHKPRTAAFDSHDNLYLADLTDRIQVFDRDGKYLSRLEHARCSTSTARAD